MDDLEKRHADNVAAWTRALASLAAESATSNGREHQLLWDAIAEIRDGMIDLDHGKASRRDLEALWTRVDELATVVKR